MAGWDRRRQLPVISPYTQSSPAMAFVVGDPTHTANVAVDRGGQLVKVTHEGDDAMAHLSLGDVRVVSWTAADGTHLQGIATFPAGYRENTPGPFLVLPHGGPEGNDPLEFDTFSRFVAGPGTWCCSRNTAARQATGQNSSTRSTSISAIAPTATSIAPQITLSRNTGLTPAGSQSLAGALAAS